jgi:hypothetical protein
MPESHPSPHIDPPPKGVEGRRARSGREVGRSGTLAGRVRQGSPADCGVEGRHTLPAGGGALADGGFLEMPEHEEEGRRQGTCSGRGVGGGLPWSRFLFS